MKKPASIPTNLFDVHVLYKSDFYQIRNFKCNFLTNHRTDVETSSAFRFCFIRSGYFEYQVFRKELEVHVGRVLLSKPQSEHRVKIIETQPDVSTIFDFTPQFYELIQENYPKAGWFFKNESIHSMIIPCGPDLDHLHHLIFQQSLKPFTDPMLLDDWVIRLVDKVMRSLENKPHVNPLQASLKKIHLSTVEKAKAFIINHANENIQLQKIADHCCVSLFHFCRIFKSIQKISPYQYLSEIRLHNAQLLLESNLPITQIAFQSGFNSLEQFDTIFRQRYQISPSAYKKAVL